MIEAMSWPADLQANDEELLAEKPVLSAIGEPKRDAD